MIRLPGWAATLAGLLLAATYLLFVALDSSASSGGHERLLSNRTGNSQQTISVESKNGGKTSLGARTVIIPTPVWVIGSYDKDGKPNVMTSSWVGVCSSKPASVMTCLRGATYTFGNIMERKAFTVNIPSESFVYETAYFGRVSGRNVDKFMKAGLTPVKSALVDAPYIKEFPMVIECKLTQTVELGSHTMFIGEIVDIKADPSILNAEGAPDMEKLKPFVYSPGSGKFYGVGKPLGDVSDLAKEKEKRER